MKGLSVYEIFILSRNNFQLFIHYFQYAYVVDTKFQLCPIILLREQIMTYYLIYCFPFTVHISKFIFKNIHLFIFGELNVNDYINEIYILMM